MVFICRTWISLIIRIMGLWVFFFFFFGPTLGARMLYWACLSFGAQWMGLRIAPTFKPHQLPPSPCVRTAWARAVIVPASIAISTCLFGLTLIAAISRMLIITLWVSRLSLLFFDDLFSFALLWSLRFLFIWCFCTSFSSGFSFIYLASGPFLKCFFFQLILAPAASPSLRALSTGTTRF